ncbi:hypothetical protein [Gemmiger formicilis]|uniref:hypothetical protein n=2 Tax=Gemmiger TaxID=204475 RepID=UPI0039910B63
MAATIALKEQTKNRMNFETGYLFVTSRQRASSFGLRLFFFVLLLSCLLPCQKQREDYRSGISEGKRPYEGLPQAVRRISICLRFPVALNLALNRVPNKARAIPHNSKCRYGERGAADAKPKAQIILDAAKVSAASGGNSEPKQGQRSQSARGFCPRSTMRVPQPDIIEHFGNADAVPQLPGGAKPLGGNCAVLPKIKGSVFVCCPLSYNEMSTDRTQIYCIQKHFLNIFYFVSTIK